MVKPVSSISEEMNKEGTSFMKNSIKTSFYEISASYYSTIAIGYLLLSASKGFHKYLLRHCRIYRGSWLNSNTALVSRSPRISGFYSFESRFTNAIVSNCGPWDQNIVQLIILSIFWTIWIL